MSDDGLAVASKVCRVCGEDKNLSEYYKDRKYKDGKRTECKHCTKQRTEEWNEQFIAEHGIEAFRQRNIQIQNKHRSTPEGRAKSRQLSANRNLAMKHLVANHRKEFDHLMALAGRSELEELADD